MGLWDDDFIPHFKRLADFIRSHDSVPAIQLGHSGRKARRYRPWEGGKALDRSPDIDDWDYGELVSSTSDSDPGDASPRALSVDEVKTHVARWGEAATRADQAGLAVMEIH